MYQPAASPHNIAHDMNYVVNSRAGPAGGYPEIQRWKSSCEFGIITYRNIVVIVWGKLV